jgi:hypothetical protein
MVAGTLPSFATLPYLWFILPAFLSVYSLRLIAGECAVVAAETVFIRFIVPVKWWQAALLSLASNIASIIAGLLVF